MYDVQEMRQDLKETIRDHYCFRDGKDESEREFDLLQNITCSNSEFDWALEGGGATGATVSFSASPVNLSRPPPNFCASLFHFPIPNPMRTKRKRKKLESAH